MARSQQKAHFNVGNNFPRVSYGGRPSGQSLVSGQVLTQGHGQVTEEVLEPEVNQMSSKALSPPHLEVHFYESSSWFQLSRTSVSLRNSFLIVLNL